MLKRLWHNTKAGLRLRYGLAFGVAAVILLSCWPGASQAVALVPSNAIRYVYTPDSELSAVIKPEAEAALYNWDAAGNLSSITRKSSTKLSIIQLEPIKGAVGETINIWGTGFSTTPGNDTVKFHGTAATVTAATAYTLAVKVPSGATTGTVTVQTTTEGPVTSSQTFTVVSVVGAPTVTSISSSLAEPGATVTVSGTNFETSASGDVVRVNQTVAELVSETSTSIKFKVPEATSGGVVSVVTPQGSATGPVLYIPPPGYTTAQVGTTTSLSYGSASTVTLSAAKTIGLAVVEGQDNEELSLALSNSTIPRGHVIVYSPRGAKIANSEQEFGEANVLLEPAVALATTGTYTVLVEPAGEYTGSVKIKPYNSTDVTGTTTPSAGGETKTVGTSVVGQNAKIAFSGTAEEKVSLVLSGATFALGTVAIYTPEGTKLAESERVISGEEVMVGPLTLPRTGTYTILISPYSEETGSIKLTTYSVVNVTGSLSLSTSGASESVSLTTPGQEAIYSVSGTAGEEVSVKTTETTFSGQYELEWYNPEGKLVTHETLSGNGFIDSVSFPTTGTYKLVINPKGTVTGSTKVTAYLSTAVTGTITPTMGGESKTVTMSVPGQNAKITFSGTAEKQVSLVLTETTFEAGSVAIYTPEGSKITESEKSVSSGGGEVKDGPITLPSTGTYTILVNPYNAYTGAIKLTAYLGSPPHGLIVKARPASTASVNASALSSLAPVAPGIIPAWRTGLAPSSLAGLAPARAVPGASSLAGQALKLSGLPLTGLHVALAGTAAAATTDAAGQFVLQGIPAGHDVLVVDGSVIGGRRYGSFEIGVDVAAGRQTTLSAPIWMTPLDGAGDHQIASPTKQPVSITTPQIPGLEVRLLAGTVIHDAAGHVVRNLNITAVPVDRPPFPLPFFANVPLYFTVQPGRAYLSKGAQIVYPNYDHLPAGQRVDFWNYDASGRGWYIYGQGSVTANAKQILPDAGVKVWEFTGAMVSTEPKPPKVGSKPGDSKNAGDPVDLGTGLFEYHRTDLVLADTIPVVIERTYRQGDSNSYSFGTGTTSRYDLRLWSENNYHEADLVLPNGGTVLYKRISLGEGFKEAEYKATETPSVFKDSVIKWDESVPGWDLTLTNGTVYVFGELAPLQAIRNRQGQQLTITHERGETGNITQITSPHGRWVKFTYDTSNRVKEIKDNGGRTLKYEYTSGLLTSATDPAERTTKYEYDGSGNMTSITDPRGNKYLETKYDANGRVSKQTEANGGVFEFGYALSGSKVESTTVTEPRENKSKVTFNSEGYSTSETQGLGSAVEQKTTFERQAGTGLLLSSTDARSRKTSYEYDSYGNPTSITRLAGTGSAQTYKYSYESGTSELTKETDPLGHSTSYEYNGKGERTARKDALGHTTHYEYNGDGQPTVITDPLSHKTTIAYQLGEPSSVTDPLGRTTKQFMDAVGRVTSTTTPGGQSTLYEYNNDNQQTKITDPLAGITSYEYDADGDLTATTDPLKHKSTAAYTKMDLLESETDALEHKTSAVYDTAGNMTQLTDRRGKVDKFSYDALNRLTESKFGVSGEAAESTIKYEYDNGNRLTKVIDSTGGTDTPEYDELNRLKSLVTPQGTVSYGYDEANRRTSMTAPGQEALKYTYDEANRLKELKRGTQAITFAYDEANRPTTTTLTDGVEEQYGYDEANELTSIAYKKGASTLGELDYSYDLDGRKEAVWGSYARTGLPEAFSSAKYNADNEQTERGTKKLGYDANGNLTSDGTSEYKWNARNQLTSITGTIKATYGYDPFGRRTTRTLGSTTTELLYDGPNVVQETHEKTVTANLLTGLAPDKVFARTTSTTTESLLADQLGSTIGLAGSTGTVATTYTYDPFSAQPPAKAPPAKTPPSTQGKKTTATTSTTTAPATTTRQPRASSARTQPAKKVADLTFISIPPTARPTPPTPTAPMHSHLVLVGRQAALEIVVAASVLAA